jgi:hypothetical protein
MNFRTDEKELIIKNVKAILAYIRKDIAPYLRDFKLIKFDVTEGQVPAMIIVNPGTAGKIEFTRGMNRTEYFLGDEYDDDYTKRHRHYRQDFWKCFDVMYAFIEDWQRIKMILNANVDKGKNIKNNLENFQV